MMSWILAGFSLTGHALYSAGFGIGWVIALANQALWLGYGLSKKERRGFIPMSLAYTALNANAVFGLWSQSQLQDGLW
jgi:hypothetical protein